MTIYDLYQSKKQTLPTRTATDKSEESRMKHDNNDNDDDDDKDKATGCIKCPSRKAACNGKRGFTKHEARKPESKKANARLTIVR